MEQLVSIASNGAVAIPLKMRKILGITGGDQLLVELVEGKVVYTPVNVEVKVTPRNVPSNP